MHGAGERLRVRRELGERVRWLTRAALRAAPGPLLLFLAAGCGGGSDDGAPGSILVAVSVPPQAEIVQRIGGDRVSVLTMVPPGVVPAAHEPTLVQQTVFDRAVLYVKVGHPRFPFEQRWMEPMQRARPKLPIVSLADSIEIIDDDPYLWLSPRVMRPAVDRIARALSELDPQHGPEYRDRARRVRAQIDSLDAYVRRTLSGCGGRPFLVEELAWGYFARDYGLIPVPIAVPEEETTDSRLWSVISRAEREGIDVVVTDPQRRTTDADVVASGIHGTLMQVDPLARDWFQTLGTTAERLAHALGCGAGAAADSTVSG